MVNRLQEENMPGVNIWLLEICYLPYYENSPSPRNNCYCLMKPSKQLWHGQLCPAIQVLESNNLNARASMTFSLCLNLGIDVHILYTSVQRMRKFSVSLGEGLLERIVVNHKFGLWKWKGHQIIQKKKGFYWSHKSVLSNCVILA